MIRWVELERGTAVTVGRSKRRWLVDYVQPRPFEDTPTIGLIRGPYANGRYRHTTTTIDRLTLAPPSGTFEP